MLEINALPTLHLAQLVEQIGERQVCRELNIHEKTLYRWRTGRSKVPGRQHLAIRALLGDLPGTAGQWSGWMFKGGKLWSPEGNPFSAGDLLASLFNAQRIGALEQENRALRVRLAIAEEAVERLAPAANEAAA